ncbi:unnamed protein product [Caenorhabditis sp. 36 PRJEB53466]|nr:unnamed protein product [Caenorhabditis sp. 36 PRJEB53466]
MLASKPFFTFAAISVFVTSISGTICNSYLFCRFVIRKSDANGFQKICLLKTVTNLLICSTFLLWVLPVTLLSFHYSDINYIVNRAIGLIAPEWAYVLTGCGYVYDPELFVWRAEDNECSRRIASIFPFLIIGPACLTNLFNVATGARLLVRKMTGMSKEKAVKKRKRWMIMFVQSVIQDCLQSFDTVNSYFIVQLNDEQWFQFLFVTLSFITVTALDGFVMFICHSDAHPSWLKRRLNRSSMITAVVSVTT